MARHVIEFCEDQDEVVIKLPDGQEVSIQYSYLEPDEQLPELDIMLPQQFCVNCWDAGLVPATPLENRPNVVPCKQLSIPIEKKVA